MVYRTSRDAIQVHGTNPQYLIDNMVRQKIYQSRYWKEDCVGLTAESLVDEAIKLQYIGGIYGGYGKPSKFLSLVLKMLQIQPDIEVVEEFIKNESYKYVTALGVFYYRLVGQHQQIHKLLEQFYDDYRKLRIRNLEGKFDIIHMDEYIEWLLWNDDFHGIVLPILPKRYTFEQVGGLPQRQSIIEKEIEEELKREEEENKQKELQEKLKLEQEQQQQQKRSASMGKRS